MKNKVFNLIVPIFSVVLSFLIILCTFFFPCTENKIASADSTSRSYAVSTFSPQLYINRPFYHFNSFELNASFSYYNVDYNFKNFCFYGKETVDNIEEFGFYFSNHVASSSSLPSDAKVIYKFVFNTSNSVLNVSYPSFPDGFSMYFDSSNIDDSWDCFYLLFKVSSPSLPSVDDYFYPKDLIYSQYWNTLPTGNNDFNLYRYFHLGTNMNSTSGETFYKHYQFVNEDSLYFETNIFKFEFRAHPSSGENQPSDNQWCLGYLQNGTFMQELLYLNGFYTNPAGNENTRSIFLLPQTSVISKSDVYFYSGIIQLCNPQFYKDWLKYSSSLDIENAYQNGYDNGWTVGRDLGYANGYNNGFNAASGGSGNQFFDLVSAVFDAPIKAFSGLFNFDVFGYNMKSVMLSLFTIAVIAFVVKIILPFG